MTTAELLITIEEAASAAFPDRATVMLRVVRRWLWFSVAVDPPAAEDAEAAVIVSDDWLRCMWCGRGGSFSLTTVATAGNRRAPPQWRISRWRATWRAISTDEPAACLCGSCAVLGSDVAEGVLPATDVVLADLARALGLSEDGPRAAQEIGRRAAGFRPPARVASAHCAACGSHSPQGAVGRDELFLCDRCLAGAAVAALEGARVQPVEEPPPDDGEPAW